MVGVPGSWDSNFFSELGGFIWVNELDASGLKKVKVSRTTHSAEILIFFLFSPKID